MRVVISLQHACEWEISLWCVKGFQEKFWDVKESLQDHFQLSSTVKEHGAKNLAEVDHDFLAAASFSLEENASNVEELQLQKLEIVGTDTSALQYMCLPNFKICWFGIIEEGIEGSS